MPFLSLDLELPQLGADMTLAPSRTSPYSRMAAPGVPGVQKGALSPDEIASFIVGTHRELCALESYEPGELVNELLTNLVAVCSEVHDAETTRKILSHHGVLKALPSLRRICSQSESCLESHWARRILQDPDDASDTLETFPYYHNYEELTRHEVCAMLMATPHPPRRIAFLGSGPLPLTSLCLLAALKGFPGISIHQKPRCDEPIEILNIDVDSNAIRLSRTLNEALGSRGEGMLFRCEDAATSMQDLRGFDVVYVAALVGQTQADKEDILLSVAERMRPGALMVIRSAWGLRTCLYPEVDITTARLRQRLESCVVVHPHGQVVNSVVVARRRP